MKGLSRFRGIAIDTRPLRESPVFRRLWIGQTISMLGSGVTMVAVPYQLYQLTHSTLLLGLLGLCNLLPLLIAPLIGGAIADAVDRRRLILWSEIALVGTSVLFAVNASLPHPQVWALFALETVATLFGGFGWPALRSALPRLVPADQLTAAMALQSVQGNLSRVAGPALGGVLIAGIGLTGTYIVDAVSFGASILAVVAMPRLAPPEGTERASLATLAEGFRFVRTQKAMLGIFLLDTNAMIFGMPRALFPAIALQRLGGDAAILGLLYGAPYVGALGATLLSGWLHRVRRMGIGVAVSATAWGFAVIWFGFCASLWPALVALAFAGAADMVSAVLRSTMVIDVTPDAMRGRVAGIELMQVASAPALGDLEAGALASATSIRFSVVSGGVACIVGSGLILLALPKLWGYDAVAARAGRAVAAGGTLP